ncbi:MAG: MBL fold metallo-hydrolase [Desulfopila sp.]|nr:MBL fold metallo-hydrolase [Desulfopila sp.]
MSRLLLILVNLAAAILLSACIFKPQPFDDKKWLETVEMTDAADLYSENFHDGIYFNPWLIREDHSFATFLKWRFSQKPSYSEEAIRNKPAVIPDLMERIAKLESDQDFIAWIGHATFLFRIQGQYWLTDPIFSERALLPKRVTPPAIQAEDLAGLQGNLNVIISHNHYDHLDKNSIRNLPAATSFYVPMGLKNSIASFAPGPVVELNWWEEIALGDDVILTCLPAQHWSRRVFEGYNTTLWASFMVSTPQKTVYFAADSGYFKGYREIGRKFTIDYALLPITAYEPRWFMHYPHMDTGEALQAFSDLRAEFFIPTQWGTFHLGDNPPGLPPLDLQRDIKEMHLDPDRFLILDIGEIRLL